MKHTKKNLIFCGTKIGFGILEKRSKRAIIYPPPSIQYARVNRAIPCQLEFEW